MKLTLKPKGGANTNVSLAKRRQLASWRTIALCWEIYPLLVIAGFLRLYQLNAAEFDGDQATIVGLARDAVSHGLIPMIANSASIGIQNPPAVIYLLMLPAAFSANPLWSAVLVGCLNLLAVLFTYLLTRRYYGRLAAMIAALLYAAAPKALQYARFPWNQNFLAPFLILFIIALFWGVVERRKGWLAPALLLLGVAIQLHETSALLLVVLLVAMALAPGTMRWRDVALGLLALLVVYAPYMLWEVTSHFSDVPIALAFSKLHSTIDTQALDYYKYLLSPNGFIGYWVFPANPHSLLGLFDSSLAPLWNTLWILTIGGLLAAALLVCWPQSPLLGNWWKDLRATPYRCGLLLLMVWQVAPVLLLLRHSVKLYLYYLLVVMPGPFILIGLFLAVVAAMLGAPIPRIAQMQPVPAIRQWLMGQTAALQQGRSDQSNAHVVARIGRYVLYALVACLLLLQVVVGATTILDEANGTNGHSVAFNDIGSLNHALDAAEQLAQQQHFSRVYIAADVNTEPAFLYLGQQAPVPTTVFDASNCLILPDRASGPAALLVGPSDTLTNALLARFANATLVDSPSRSGGAPFRLYSVTTPAQAVSVTGNTFAHNLQLLDVSAQALSADTPLWSVSRWRLLRSIPAATRTSYHYLINVVSNGNNREHGSGDCGFSALRAGDEMLVAVHLPAAALASSPVTLAVQTFAIVPYNPWHGSLHFETSIENDTPFLTLATMDGQQSITVSP